MKEKILNYLANGLKPSQVATLVGCTPAYISQLLGDEGFKAQLTARMMDNPVEADDKLEDKYLALEHTLVGSVADALPHAELPAITRALEVVAKIRADRHAKKNPIAAPTTNNAFIVQLTLPDHALKKVPTVELNEKSEIISIDNKPMAPLSSTGVKNLFARMKERQQAEPLQVEL